jgi:hypothetical protein
MSRYALAFGLAARARELHFSVPHFRGFSGELNLAPRSYHAGDFEEVGWILGRIRERAGAPVIAAGVSLGGNALLRWVEEAGSTAAQVVCAGCRHLRAVGPRGRRRHHRPRVQLARLLAYIPAHDEAARAGKVAATSEAIRPRAAARGTHAARLRRLLHRAAAWLCRSGRPLAPRVGQAAPEGGPRARPRVKREAIRSCRATRCPTHTKAVFLSRCGNRTKAATLAFPPVAGPATCTRCLMPYATGWLLQPERKRREILDMADHDQVTPDSEPGTVVVRETGRGHFQQEVIAGSHHLLRPVYRQDSQGGRNLIQG